MIGRRGRLHLIVAAALLSLTCFGARAGAQSNEELMQIIREQQRQIDELSRKVDALTGETTAAGERADQASEQAAAAAEAATKVADDSNFIFAWGPSPTITSRDGNWSVHLRGRLFVDGGYLDDQDGFYRNDNATEVRASASRARCGTTSTTSSRSTSPTTASRSRMRTSNTAARSSSRRATSGSGSTRRRTRWKS